MALLSDEFHEFGKVLNPKMTNAYFTKASLLVWVRSACRSVKGQVVVWGNQY
jgi:diphosphomevalonate decarboxylase